MSLATATSEAQPRLELERARRVGMRNPALPFYVIAGLPLFWAVGLGYFTFAIAGAVMGISLLTMQPLRIPKGFGLWLLFLGWALVSSLTLDVSVTRYLSFSVRAAVYIGATTTFLFVYNMPKRYLPTGRVLGVLGGVFALSAIVGGYLGLILGEVRFPTLMSQVLPQSLLENSFVSNVVQPPFAQRQDFLGFPINRPSFPFSFTNDWAASLAPAVFAAVAAAGRMGRYRRWVPALAVLALVPMVVSANRGLWVTLILAVIYVAARRATSGQLILAVRLLFVMILVGIGVLLSPLGEIVGARAVSEHSFEARGDIYTDVLERVPESPLLGFGAPIANPQPFRPAIGTHGMFWTALFSQGIPGAVFYVGFWLSMAIRTGRNLLNQEHLLLHLAVVTSLPTMLFYDHLPAALPIMMICSALILRDRKELASR